MITKENLKTNLVILLLTVLLSIAIIFSVAVITFNMTLKTLNDRKLKNQIKVKYPICKMYYEYDVYRNIDGKTSIITIDTIPIDTICVKSYIP